MISEIECKAHICRRDHAHDACGNDRRHFPSFVPAEFFLGFRLFVLLLVNLLDFYIIRFICMSILMKSVFILFQCLIFFQILRILQIFKFLQILQIFRLFRLFVLFILLRLFYVILKKCICIF